jgi:hypothetical protein
MKISLPTPMLLFYSRVFIFALELKLQNAFFEYFLPCMKTSERISQTFSEFELEKLRTHSEIFVQGRKMKFWG